MTTPHFYHVISMLLKHNTNIPFCCNIALWSSLESMVLVRPLYSLWSLSLEYCDLGTHQAESMISIVINSDRTRKLSSNKKLLIIWLSNGQTYHHKPTPTTTNSPRVKSIPLVASDVPISVNFLREGLNWMCTLWLSSSPSYPLHNRSFLWSFITNNNFWHMRGVGEDWFWR